MRAPACHRTGATSRIAVVGVDDPGRNIDFPRAEVRTSPLVGRINPSSHPSPRRRGGRLHASRCQVHVAPRPKVVGQVQPADAQFRRRMRARRAASAASPNRRSGQRRGRVPLASADCTRPTSVRVFQRCVLKGARQCGLRLLHPKHPDRLVPIMVDDLYRDAFAGWGREGPAFGAVQDGPGVGVAAICGSAVRSAATW
jgi:hypothetical protein